MKSFKKVLGQVYNDYTNGNPIPSNDREIQIDHDLDRLHP